MKKLNFAKNNNNNNNNNNIHNNNNVKIRACNSSIK